MPLLIPYTTFTITNAYIGHIRLDKLTEQHLGDMWRKLAAGENPDGSPRKPLVATTLSKRHVHLSAALNAAARSRHVPVAYNPAREARPERGDRKRIPPLSEDEARRLLAATADDPDYPAWVLLLTIGMRPGQLAALRWDDLDTERRRLAIRAFIHRETGKGLVAGPAKTRRARSVSLRPEALAALRRQRAHQAELRLAAGPLWEDHGYIFSDAAGRPVNRPLLLEHFKRACQKAGIPVRTLRDCRHSFATLGLVRGAPVKVVSEALGHARVGVTLDIYSHVVPGLDERALGYLDDLFQTRAEGQL
jgi:integrase